MRWAIEPSSAVVNFEELERIAREADELFADGRGNHRPAVGAPVRRGLLGHCQGGVRRESIRRQTLEGGRNALELGCDVGDQRL